MPVTAISNDHHSKQHQPEGMTDMATDNGFVIDTQEGMQMWRLMSMRANLRIEVGTGMSNSRGSTMKVVNKEFGTKFTKKADALEFMCGVIDYMTGKSDQLPEVKGMEWAQPN